ncbi:MAG: hypothetical protein PHO36_16235 [Parabacteroides sp.]|nr:hypothetical protein [Parabacteroides sp.]
MKTRTKIITVAVFVFVVVWISLIPLVTLTNRHQFFDINNGRVRVKWESLGVTYRDRVEETPYSILLKDMGFEELPPDWRLANSAKIGFFWTLHQTYRDIGGLPSSSEMFVMWLELQKKISPQDKREHVNKFRTLVREGTSKQVKEYINSLPYDEE